MRHLISISCHIIIANIINDLDTLWLLVIDAWNYLCLCNIYINTTIVFMCKQNRQRVSLFNQFICFVTSVSRCASVFQTHSSQYGLRIVSMCSVTSSPFFENKNEFLKTITHFAIYRIRCSLYTFVNFSKKNCRFYFIFLCKIFCYF